MNMDVCVNLLSEEEIREIALRLDALTDRFKSSSVLFKNQVSIDRVFAIDLLAYEEEEALFFDSPQAFFFEAGLALGDALVTHLGFKWCEVSTAEGTMLSARCAYNGAVVPLVSSVLRKWFEMPQFGSIESLFMDIFLANSFPVGTNFFFDANLEIDDDEYAQQWGFAIPPSVASRMRAVLERNKEYAVRVFGLAAYDWRDQPEWGLVSDRLILVERAVEEFMN